MDYSKFPYSFKTEQDEIVKQKIDRVIENRDRNISRLRSACDNEVKNLSSRKNTTEPNVKDYASGGFITGLIAGVIVCCVTLKYEDTLSSRIFLVLMIGLVGLVLGLVLRSVVESRQNGENNKIDGEISLEKNKGEQRIIIENQKCDDEIQRIRDEANKQYANYLADFNNEAQRMSVRYAESELAVKVINWMTDGFSRTIDAADRRSHIPEINIPFVFKTYKNGIECNIGKFDFEIERCEELNSPLEQTAVARAIASAIQLNITIKYPQDASGTKIVIQIDYDYSADNVASRITYIAPNGNYRPTSKWATN